MPTTEYQVRVLDRLVAILNCFQGDRLELGVTELSKILALNKSTVHRLLEALKAHGLVVQDSESQRYSLGLKLFELGSRAVASVDVLEKSKPVLEKLVAETGETAHLCVLDDKEVLYLEKFESPKTLRIPSRVGQRNPAHCTAVGKALLAHLPGELDSWFRSKPLKRFTANTITDLRSLREELASIREHGFSIDNEEIELGLRCVAAEVRDYSGKVIAAISIAGPSFRVTDDRIPSLAESVKRATAALSEKMGYRVLMEVPKRTRSQDKYKNLARAASRATVR